MSCKFWRLEHECQNRYLQCREPRPSLLVSYHREGSMGKKKVDISKFINVSGNINIFEVIILTINWIVLIASGAVPSVLFWRSGGG